MICGQIWLWVKGWEHNFVATAISLAITKSRNLTTQTDEHWKCRTEFHCICPSSRSFVFYIAFPSYCITFQTLSCDHEVARCLLLDYQSDLSVTRQKSTECLKYISEDIAEQRKLRNFVTAKKLRYHISFCHVTSRRFNAKKLT